MDKYSTLRLLNRFVDYGRKNISTPFSQELKIGKYLCATDGTILVLMPETDEVKIINEEGFNPPSVNSIIPNFKEEIKIDFNDILKLYDAIPIVEIPVVEECDSCDGKGDFYHYGHTYDCEKCNKSGKLSTNFMQKVKSPKTVFRIKNIDIDIKYISGLIDVFNHINSKVFSIAYLGSNMVWFKMDKIYVAIAGKYKIEQSHVKWDIVEINL